MADDLQPQRKIKSLRLLDQLVCCCCIYLVCAPVVIGMSIAFKGILSGNFDEIGTVIGLSLGVSLFSLILGFFLSLPFLLLMGWPILYWLVTHDKISPQYFILSGVAAAFVTTILIAIADVNPESWRLFIVSSFCIPCLVYFKYYRLKVRDRTLARIGVVQE